jgi:hypothetical protein
LELEVIPDTLDSVIQAMSSRFPAMSVNGEVRGDWRFVDYQASALGILFNIVETLREVVDTIADLCGWPRVTWTDGRPIGSC